MANTQDIRRRIKSIRNTAQITKAMQMVAASKMRKAQQHALAGRPYAALMNKVLVSLQRRTDPRLHPLLHIRPVKKELVLIISTDKGLCGALNTNLFREAANFDSAKTAFVVTGKKARQFIARTKRELLADFELKDAPTFVETKPIAKFCMEKFLNRDVDKVSVLYTHFINTINQRSVVQTLLPISSFDLPKSESDEKAKQDVDPMLGYVFEPNAETVLDMMLPYYLQYQLFQMILDARASEHSARMVAMKNATDNANQFIKDLTLEYNKMRQAGITMELLEIATAQMSLGG
ncbi:MAG: ATP synthase F1 subunit gamma [Verrucomicrobia bacterium]|nr:MAG: ATP synthase F1 subunit gamma [Verrucomicrobiota bacterium]PYK33063.1 MAG: ATP synthase F1 subunit gamma [Verrucomicrobiota bacterium]PYL21533.1 MAG: ATP synthase F1 subunit gamma [Verrucomicrobiota bacterium]PYL79652.1 MAG: ATP synthase F1 subunit gamma [Verrucomicrobiota bacterium]